MNKLFFGIQICNFLTNLTHKQKELEINNKFLSKLNRKLTKFNSVYNCTRVCTIEDDYGEFSSQH